MIPVLPSTPENIESAGRALKQGRLVAMPTETVYGLAGDAFNPAALAAIFEVKQRPFFDPLIVHIADRSRLNDLCRDVPAEAEALMDQFWPGPLTVVLPKRATVPDLATSGLATVAVRMPAHPVALDLLRAAGTPLAAPSANRFGELSPTSAAHVAAAFSQGLDCVLDGGDCSVGVESTVIAWTGDQARILRAGGIALEEIETALGKKLGVGEGPGTENPPSAPGQLPWHYAPHAPLTLVASEIGIVPSRCALLWFGENVPPGFAFVENLSPAGDLRAAAARLFGALHRLDAAGPDRIYARLVPESGLGRAINDRLRKAAATPDTGARGSSRRRE